MSGLGNGTGKTCLNDQKCINPRPERRPTKLSGDGTLSMMTGICSYCRGEKGKETEMLEKKSTGIFDNGPLSAASSDESESNESHGKATESGMSSEDQAKLKEGRRKKSQKPAQSTVPREDGGQAKNKPHVSAEKNSQHPVTGAPPPNKEAPPVSAPEPDAAAPTIEARDERGSEIMSAEVLLLGGKDGKKVKNPLILGVSELSKGVGDVIKGPGTLAFACLRAGLSLGVLFSGNPFKRKKFAKRREFFFDSMKFLARSMRDSLSGTKIVPTAGTIAMLSSPIFTGALASYPFAAIVAAGGLVMTVGWPLCRASVAVGRGRGMAEAGHRFIPGGLVFPGHEKGILQKMGFRGSPRPILDEAYRNPKWTHTAGLSDMDVDRLNKLFEKVTAVAGLELGYEVELHGVEGAKKYGHQGSGDGEKDNVWIDKNGVKTLVSCKRYASKVDVGDVRKLHGACHDKNSPYYGSKGMMVTTVGYTAPAKAFAEGNRITLVTLDQTIDMVRKKA